MPRRRTRTDNEEESSTSPKKRRHRYNLRNTPSRENRTRLLGGDQEGRRPVVSDEEHRERIDALKVIEKPGKTFAVTTVDLHTAKNRESHHTDEFELEDLILRRGQKFDVTITADRDISKEHDILVLQFVTGARPQESKGTVIRIPVNIKVDGSKTSDATKSWSIETGSVGDKSVAVAVTPAPDAIIGKYNLFVETKIKDSDEDFQRHEHDGDIYVLFNPWCKEDTVYMEEEDKKEEYVLNETGRIWIGSAFSNYGRPWNFGQFDSPCLEVALFLMDKAELADSARCSVVSVIRTISEWVNSCDDSTGVLTGRWTETYPKNSTKPWEWTGSVAILKEYWEKRKAVEFGQCWVFSGLTTTLCRAVGIPTRSVTNFESAHDSDSSMTIDFHFDKEGDPVEWMNDSVWNFHVWNESWLRRLDLPAGYDGWQAHDGTPQESSEGVMRCGPAPMKAIKEGQVYLNWDVGFVFSEVNGDRINWEVDSTDGSMTVTNIDKRSVGKRISTKAVGHQFLREDLTDSYKYPDGSAEERKAVEFVNRYSTRRKHNIYELDHKPELEYTTNLPSSTMIGEDFEIDVFLVNTSKEDRNVKTRLTLIAAYYTGVAGRRIKGETYEMEIKAGEKKTVTMTVNSKEYVKQMNSSGLFQIYGTCRIQETNRVFAKEASFSLKKPVLTIEAPDEIPRLDNTPAVIHFKNTTKLKLHNGVFHIEAARMSAPKTIHTKKTIEPGEEVTAEIILNPTRWARGRKEIVANFSSDEVSEIEGSLEVLIVTKPDPSDED